MRSDCRFHGNGFPSARLRKQIQEGLPVIPGKNVGITGTDAPESLTLNENTTHHRDPTKQNNRDGVSAGDRRHGLGIAWWSR